MAIVANFISDCNQQSRLAQSAIERPTIGVFGCAFFVADTGFVRHIESVFKDTFIIEGARAMRPVTERAELRPPSLSGMAMRNLTQEGREAP